MPIIKCSNGHNYDNNKFDKCPICGETDIFTQTKNKYVFSAGIDKNAKEGLTERYDDKTEEGNITVSIDMKKGKNTFTTGWLVCVTGECKGKSFPIKTNRNFIGRDFDMDIVIPDKNVSRIKHCSIVYDDKKSEFYLVHGNSPTMVNNKFIKESIKLKENDLLSLGESEYVFIPYCKFGRSWND